MARIRTIKPEFPHSESIGALSRDARLLFIQLWTLVDDDGRTRAASRMLASLLYPYDDDAAELMTGWLAELEEGGLIRVYNVDGSHYLEILNWLKHQKIDHPSKSRLPECPADFAKVREASRSLAPDLGPRTSTKDLDHSRAVAKATRTQAASKFEEFWKVYPRRLGANPKGQAEELFIAAVKRGADPGEIIAGAVRFAAHESENVGTPYIPQAVKWIRNRCWIDGATDPPDSGLSDDERKAMFEKLRKPNEQRAGTDLRGAGAGPRESEGAGRKEPASTANHQARHAGMASLDAIFRKPLGVRASSDETSAAGDEPVDDGP